MATTPAWKLRRLATRAKRVQARRASESPVIAAYATTLPGKATAFIAAYDAAAKYENTWRREMREGKGAVAALLRRIQSWLPLLVRDVPEFDASTFGDKPDVPDDVIEDGGRLAEVLEESTTADGKPLTYKVDALKELIPSLEAANKEWSEAEAADTTYQKLLKESRATAVVFDKELQTFRRSLAHAVGRNDKDFQKLRVERASQKDDDDDPAAPATPAPVTPAAEGAALPTGR
ncbi:hypothetical protein [Polyangium jinanense]|uniref:Uncharacterized protein n=1 Tax=Polyangium jinanense TaxID=2829994 RepID=A0A9X3XEC5_9BACT|nr:hypothetical protein [Polyangium jinanense]MDC3962457.1 hypothetical protein [Polyangium jinanense]MDC3988617.1 hypothetical protein [Polyangium jinanense]